MLNADVNFFKDCFFRHNGCQVLAWFLVIVYGYKINLINVYISVRNTFTGAVGHSLVVEHLKLVFLFQVQNV